MADMFNTNNTIDKTQATIDRAASENRLVSQEEISRLGDFNFTFKRKKNFFGRRTRSARENKSNELTKTGITQADYEKLLNFNVFSGNIENIEGIREQEAKFVKFNDQNKIIRKSGEELSLLDQADFDALLQSISGRRAQLQQQAVSPGFERQSFSLLSGNFS